MACWGPCPVFVCPSRYAGVSQRPTGLLLSHSVRVFPVHSCRPWRSSTQGHCRSGISLSGASVAPRVSQITAQGVRLLNPALLQPGLRIEGAQRRHTKEHRDAGQEYCVAPKGEALMQASGPHGSSIVPPNPSEEKTSQKYYCDPRDQQCH